MQNKQKYIIFLDIDGTIWDHRVPIHEKTINAVKKAREAGHKVFINTGRSYAFIPSLIFEQMSFDGVVAGLGADVRIGGTQIYSKCVSKEALTSTYDFMIQNNKIGMFEGERNVYSINFENSSLIKIKDKNHYIEIFTPDIPDNKVSKIHIGGILSDADRAFLEQHYCVIQHETYSEMAIPNITKATGIDIVLDAYKDEGDFKIIACGDSANDVEMLEKADYGVAMGNSVEEIKRMADIITDTAANGGVGIVIEQIIGV